MRKALEPDPRPRLRVYARIFGTEIVTKGRAAYLDARPNAKAEDAARTADQARAEIEALGALTPAEAVRRIEQTRATGRAAGEAATRALAERSHELPSRSHSRDTKPRYDEPGLSR